MGGAWSILPWQTPHVDRKSRLPIDSEADCTEGGGPAAPVPRCAAAFPASITTAKMPKTLLRTRFILVHLAISASRHAANAGSIIIHRIASALRATRRKSRKRVDSL